MERIPPPSEPPLHEPEAPEPPAAPAGDAGAADDGKVGYKRPPRHLQFKPGHSGHKEGRPKHSRNMATIVRTFFEELIEVREGDRSRKITRKEALVRSNYSRAIKGDARAAAMLMSLLKVGGLLEAPDDAAADPFASADSEALLADYIKRFAVTASPPQPKEAAAKDGKIDPLQPKPKTDRKP